MDNDDVAIVTAIIAFAYSLHLKAVAEGVEKTLPSFNSGPRRAVRKCGVTSAAGAWQPDSSPPGYRLR